MRNVDSKTQFAWKKAPFGYIRKVPPFEGARWPAYQRRPQKTAKRRDWTRDEDEQIDALLDQGLSYGEIARRLGRPSGDAVRTHLKRRKIVSLTKRYATLTARQVAHLFGIPCSKTITRWIKQGWLKARAAESGRADGRAIWRITWDDLLAFLEKPEAWISWSPERITDSDLRARAEELRAAQPRLLTMGEVAARYHVAVATVAQWINKGWLPAVRYGTRGNRSVPESALEGFVPPCMQSRTTWPVAPGRWPRWGWRPVQAEPRFRRRAA